MYVMELFNPAPAGYQDQRADQSVMSKLDSRKNRQRITFAHLNQLRISHDIRKLEHEQKLKQVSKQYTPAPEGGGGLPPM